MACPARRARLRRRAVTPADPHPEDDPVIRIAARGDGVTLSGLHVPGSVTGDVMTADGTLILGPHRAKPPCRHFPTCGACQLQHADDEAIAGFITERIRHAAEAQGLVAGRIASPHLSPPRTRRRATLHAAMGGSAAIGFREGGSNRIVDMRECHVLHPRLFALVDPLRRLIAQTQKRWAGDITLTLTDQGVDCGLANWELGDLASIERLTSFATEHGLARITVNQGYGAETQWEPQPVTVALGKVAVPFPPGSFLQATADGEAALTEAATEWLDGAGPTADLFAGLGTFACALAGPRRVLAVEASRDAHLALKAGAAAAGVPVFAMHRDLFRNPLMPDELARFDAVVLDPPRAGAREQIAHLATSDVPRIVYVSCNPSTWARDAGRLVAGGYRLEEVRPVGQFRWSTHVELASLFVR